MFDDWNCAISWIPILVIENANEMRKNQAAVESFRNDMVRANQGLIMVQTLMSERAKLANGGAEQKVLP